MTITAAIFRGVLAVSALLWTGRIAAAEVPANEEPVALRPFQVLGRALELVAVTHNRDGEQILEYVQVKRLAKGSNAERAGLKEGDQIVAIGTWRLARHELQELEQNFPTTLHDGQATLPLKVRRSLQGEEREVFLAVGSPKAERKEAAKAAGP